MNGKTRKRRFALRIVSALLTVMLIYSLLSGPIAYGEELGWLPDGTFDLLYGWLNVALGTSFTARLFWSYVFWWAELPYR